MAPPLGELTKIFDFWLRGCPVNILHPLRLPLRAATSPKGRGEIYHSPKSPMAIPAAADRRMMIMGWTFFIASTSITAKIAADR